jgi:glucose-1-phosphate cytidylyltransferase
MKAVLLAGGLGTRMREETEFRPKPMVDVGGRPVLWHIMKVLASQGITDFVILTGYKGDVIRRYFHDYESLNLDFTVQLGQNSSTEYHGVHGEDGWRVTILDTGALSLTGERLLRAKEHLMDSRFILTYGDGLADINLENLITQHISSDSVVTLSMARPNSRFGVLETDSAGRITKFAEKAQGSELVNIGYMIAEPELLDYLEPGQALEDGPLKKLAQAGKLSGFLHEGFWQPMDTQRELELLTELWDSGRAPWVNW